ncbi:MAG: hypothetical protein HYX32_04300 [Actinobacteria bacterium]|nr:hypothetical protein [Actinomycetota bacterium]
MTTLPLEDPADPAVDVLESPRTDADTPIDLDPADEHPGGALSTLHDVLHPVQWWEGRGRRYLPGVSFPLAVFVVWRLVHLWMNVRQYSPAYSGPWDTALFYDGERYRAILHVGYANPRVLMPNTAFFPLLSWLAAPIYWLTKNDLWTVHLTASITGIGAFVTVWGVTKAWVGERIARRSVLLMALFPSSLFLWAFYSEGLFIMLGAGGVWADRKGKRGLAAICFLGLAATRSIGILLPIVVVAARIIRNGPSLTEIRRRWYVVASASLAGAVVLASVVVPLLEPSVLPRLAAATLFVTVVAVTFRRTTGAWAIAGTSAIGSFVLAFLGTGNLKLLVPPMLIFGVWALGTRRLDRWCVLYPLAGAIGFGAVLLVLWRQAGDPFAFMRVQEDWGRALAPAWGSVTEGFKNLYPDENTIMIPALVARNFDLWSVPIIFFGLGYLMFSRKEKFPMEAWMIGVAFILLPLVSSVLASFNRFVMADWVIYPAYAAFLERFVWRLRVGFAVAGWSIVGLAVRLSASSQFEIPPWLKVHPALFFVGMIVGLVIATQKVYVTWRAVLYTGLAAAALWTSWLMVGRLSVDRFVG